MNITCPVFDRLGKHQINQLDHGSIPGVVEEVSGFLDFRDDAVRGFVIHDLEKFFSGIPAEVV